MAIPCLESCRTHASMYNEFRAFQPYILLKLTENHFIRGFKSYFPCAKITKHQLEMSITYFLNTVQKYSSLNLK